MIRCRYLSFAGIVFCFGLLLAQSAAAAAPAITAQPVSAVVTIGQAASLSVSNTGTAPVGYQWLKDGVILSGQTNSTLSFNPFKFSDSGSYSVVITNAQGMAISRPANLSVPNALLRAWGRNDYSQLGNGTTIHADLPITVASNVVSAAGGTYHSLFVKADGTLWAMGFNYSGQLGNGTTNDTTRPIQVTSNVVAAAGGSAHSLFVKADGTLWAMGWNYYGQLGNGQTGSRANTNLPVQVASNVVAAAGGDLHTLFIKSDGTLWAMGGNSDGQLGNGTTTSTNRPVQVASNVVAAAAGYSHSLFVKADGTLWAMGKNDAGQLGNGTTNSANWPVQVASNVVAAAAGYAHTLFIKANGTLWTVGYNFGCQLGAGWFAQTNWPIQVASNVVTAAGGSLHSLFVKDDGTLWAMGDNFEGSLGNDSTIVLFAAWPIQVSGGLKVASLAKIPGSAHCLAIAGEGPVASVSDDLTVMAGQTAIFTASVTGDGPFIYQWQLNGSNIVDATNATYTITGAALSDAGNYAVVVAGYGTTTSTVATLTVIYNPPVITAQPVGAVATIGQPASLSVSNTGTAPIGYQWLKDGVILSGQTNRTVSFNPFKFTDSGSYSVVITNARGMAISRPANMGVTNVPLRVWGSNGDDQLGNGTTGGFTNRPIQVASNVVAAAGGTYHSLFVKADGTLWAMGDNYKGQLGNGTTGGSTNRPIQVAGNVVAAAAGSMHSLFVKADGTLWAMGYNEDGQLGNGTTGGFTNRPVQVASNVVAAAAGSWHSLFVKADGTLWAMGYNEYGQLGNGTTGGFTNRPVQVASNVVAAAAGGFHSLFVKADGTLWAMGYNIYGQLGNGTTANTNRPIQVASNVVAVAAGKWHSLFMKADSKLWAMGDNGNGELGNYAIWWRELLPVQVASNVVAAAAGEGHSRFVKADGTLWAMGNNAAGELGNGTTTSTNLPVQVSGSLLTASLAQGSTAGHSLVIAGALPVVSNQTVTVGQPVSLTALGGDLPLTYQWQFNGTNIANATSASYAMASAAVSHAGIYAVVVTGPYGTQTNTAILRVRITPTVTTWPTASAILIGQTLAASTLSGGAASVAGAFAFTSPSSVPAEGAALQGVTFTPTNENSYNSVTGSVSVAVIHPPAITAQPVSAVAAIGEEVSLSVSNNGTAPFGYQWIKDGVILAGQTNRTLSFRSFKFTDSGSYSVMVTDNAQGLAISRPANLSVTNAPLRVWGSNSSGQLGNGMCGYGTLTARPIQVASNVVAAAGGQLHSLFVKADSTLWAMGYNESGQLGNGANESSVALPVQVASNVVAAAAGDKHSLFVKADGTLWAMGVNDNGQLGNGTRISTNRPVQVASNVVAAACGGRYSLFVKADGTLWAMGYNEYGQLGNGTSGDNSFLPVQVANHVVAVAGGWRHSLFVKTDGTLWAMGYNEYGQLGNGTTNNAILPVQVASNVVAAAGGGGHSLFVKADRTLWTMGRNEVGQLGNGTTNNAILPVKVASNVVAAAAGDKHSFFVKADGTLWAMGDECYGQLGNGTTGGYGVLVFTNLPVQVSGGLLTASLAKQTLSNHSLVIAGAVLTVTVSDRTVAVGQTIIFTACTTGDGPLTYQWQLNGATIVNATNDFYTISNATLSNAGSYAVVVAGAYGSTASAAATLTVTDPPVITAQPVSAVVTNGQAVSLSVSNSGAEPFGYQWIKDGVILVGQTNRTLKTNIFKFTDSGSYSVVITNAQGMAISRLANLSVPNAPLRVWGMNGSGQLGIGTGGWGTFTNQPIQVASDVAAAAAGYSHSLFVNADGTLWAMGDNYFGQLGNGTKDEATLPVQVASNVAAAAAGAYHSLFVKADGTLWSMGRNFDGQLGNGKDGISANTNLPVQVASNVVAAAGGLFHSLFVKADGTLWAMGNNEAGQLGNGTSGWYTSSGRSVQVASNVVAVAGGNSHSLFVKADGTLWAMGLNAYGQLGNGTTNNANLPVQVASHVVAVAGGGDHSLFVKADGTLWAMGRNDVGQLGNGANESSVALPVQVASHVVAAAGGNWHSLFVKADGTLWAMGQNNYGQLGNGTTNNANLPVEVSRLLTAILAKGASAYHSMAIAGAVPNVSVMSNQTITVWKTASFTASFTGDGPFTYQWQFNGTPIVNATNPSYTISSAALSDAGHYAVVVVGAYGTTTSAVATLTVVLSDPPAITAQPVSAAVTISQEASLSVSNSGTAPFGYQWLKDGVILAGQTNSTLRIPSFKFTDSGSYSVVITNAGAMTISQPASLSIPNAPLRGWGRNSSGQLAAANTRLPVTVASNVVAAAGGAAHSLFLKADNTLWAMGNNDAGQLGNGSTDSTNRPVLVASNVVAAAGGAAHSLFLKADSTLWAMGNNEAGQLGNGTTGGSTNRPIQVASNVAAVAGGSEHSLFVRSDGTLWAMGNNSEGQMGNGTKVNANWPVLVASNVVAAACGASHSLFVKTDGTLWAMGNNSEGQLGNGKTGVSTNWPIQVASNVAAAAAGGLHSLFVKADGTLWAMGNNEAGQLGNGTTGGSTNRPIQVASNVVVAAGGNTHSLFVKADGTLWAMGNNSEGQLGNGTTNNANLPVQVSGGLLTACLAKEPMASHSLAIACAVPTVTAMSNQTVTVGQTANFTASVIAGDDPFTYQWQFNGTNIANATNGSYTISGAAVSAAGNYAVVVAGPYGSLSTDATLTVNKLPTIVTTWPTASAIPLGQTLAASTLIGGAASVAGAFAFTSPSSVPVEGAALYGVTFTPTDESNYNSVTGSVSVTVVPPPAITAQPMGAVVTMGSATNLSVSHSGTGPFGYQWIKDGVILAGQTNRTLSFSAFKFIDSGSYSVAITDDRQGMAISRPANLSTPNAPLRVWGINDAGQLGNGTSSDTNRPIQVASNVVAAAGGSHSLFVKADGTLWAMGANWCGQLGDGTKSSTNLPIQVASNVVAAAAGNAYSLFVKADGTLWAMGRNDYGQLGNGTKTDANRPVQVASNVAAAATGLYHSLFVKADGSLWVMGLNEYGQLGNGTTNNSSLPVQVARGVVAVSAGYWHSLFVKADGTLWAMGANWAGQLGNGTTGVSVTRPIQVASNVVAATGGGNSSLFVKAGGSLWAMGRNEYGQLGNGTSGISAFTNLPVHVASNVATAAGGEYHSLFVKADGTLWAMGRNLNGQLGNGTTNTANLPVQVSGGLLTAGLAKASLASHSLVIAGVVPTVSVLSNQTVTVGQTANFTVSVTGDGPFTYQWQFNGTTIANATSDSYMIASADVSHSGHYAVVVVGACGTTTSTVATLTVNKITSSVTAWPTASDLAIGQALAASTLSGGAASVAGTFAFTTPGIVPAEGAASQSVTFTPFDTNSYTSVAGTVTVTVVFLQPAITAQPMSAVVTMGSAASLSVSNSGTGPFGYQWLKDGVILTGQTNGTLSFGLFKFTDSGSYSVAVTGNRQGVAISRPASLSVPNAPLRVWGYNNSGQLGNGTDGLQAFTNRPIQVASNVVAAAGGSHSLFVKADGTLWAMGYNGFGQLGNGTTEDSNRPVQVANNVLAVAAGNYHSLFVKADGTLWAMGRNDYGQLGNGTTGVSVTRPVQVADNVVALAGGNTHSLFVRADGTLWAMGRNDCGQLGNGTKVNASLPVQVANNVVAVAAGISHSLFVKADGSLWAMGYNYEGELGNGTNDDATLPIQVASSVVAASGGGYHSLFVKADGTLWAMGYNWNGQLGNGTTTSTNRPVQVVSNVVAAVGGWNYSLFVKDDGTLWAMGYNANGELGNGTTGGSTNRPVQVSGGLLTAGLAKKPVAGHSLVIAGVVPTVSVLSNQTVTVGQTVNFTVSVTAGDGPFTYQWQLNGTNIINATYDSYTISNAAVSDAGNYAVVVAGVCGSATSAVATLTVFIVPPAITAQPVSAVVTNGQAASLSVSNSGTAPLGYQWLKDGVILAGQTNRTLNFSAFKFTDSGSYSVVITNSGGMTISLPASLSVPNAPLRAWGSNGSGQLGNGAAGGSSALPIQVASNVVATAAGQSHSLFVKADRELWAMGYNKYGQLGNGTTNDAARPVNVASNAVAAAAGVMHSLFVKADGTLWAMGGNGSGQLGNGTAGGSSALPIQVASNVVATAAGKFHSLFVKADGTLWAMGDNWYGQMGNVSGLGSNWPVLVASNVVAAAAGDLHSLFVRADGTLWAMGFNWYGQLGNGTAGNSTNQPSQVASNVVAAAAGYAHTLFVKADGTLWAMGNNAEGELGNGMSGWGVCTNMPIQVASNVVATAGGYNHSLFVKTDGTLWAIGVNGSGQLGTGTTDGRSTWPVQVSGGLLTAGLADGSSASHALAIAGALPVVSVSNRTVTVGQTTHFTASVTGDGPFTYQWQLNGATLAQATNASYTISSATVSHAGNYSVVVAGTYGTTTSAVATLTVNKATPSVTAWPTASAITLGQALAASTLSGGSASVAGAFAFTTPGTVPAAGTAAQGVLFTPADTASYNSVTGSVSVTVAVAPPAITAQPVSDVVPIGEAASLSVSNSGTAPLGYQWLKDGAILSGQTNRTLSFSAFTFTDSGSYSVVITNSGGMALSLPASLSVPNAPLRAWGGNGSGQLGNGTTVSASLPVTVASNVVATAGGQSHSLVVKADGTLWAMGGNNNGQLGIGTTASTDRPVQVASNVVAAAGGQSHSLFVKADGTLWAMGYNNFGQLGNGTTGGSITLPVQVASNVVAAACGYYHSLFVKADGTLWAMGWNNNGRLGNGTTISANRPVQVASHVVAAASGNDHSLFVKADGTLWAMGANNLGQLGIGTTGDSTLPVLVTNHVAAVAAGYAHTLFVKADGTLWAMGNNAEGELGNGTAANANLPVQMASNVVAAAGGVYHTLFVRSDGTLWGTGQNAAGQLGNGTTANTNRPALINGGGLMAVSIAKGSTVSHSLAIAGALPAATVASRTVTVGQTTHFTASVTGDSPFTYQWRLNGSPLVNATNGSYTISSAALSSAGNYAVVVAGACGSTTSAVATLTVNKATPSVTAWPTASAILLGQTLAASTLSGGAGSVAGAFAFTSPGTVPAAGTTAQGVLFTPTDTGSYDSVTGSVSVTAVAPPAITAQPVSDVVTRGGAASLSVSNSGTGPFGYQWLKDGVILAGQTNSTLSFSAFTFTDSGSYSVVITNVSGMAISLPASLSTPNAPLRVWGRNNYSQLGNGTAANTSLPSTVASNVAAAAGGGYHALFVKTDGTLWAMGKNEVGQLGNGTTGGSSDRPIQVASTVVAAAGGSDHSLFVKANGTLWAMGYNSDGQLGNGTKVNANLPIQVASNVVAAAGGKCHSLFVKADGTLWAMGRNLYGQLGNGTSGGSITWPAQVASNVVSVSGGGEHSLFVKADGTLWVMGYNNKGQLGNGTTANANRPVQVASNVVVAAGGYWHSLFVKADGTLWTMGSNNYGQLGNGTSSDANQPVQVASNVVAATVGESHSLFVKADGRLWAMGQNDYGQLGNGKSGWAASTNLPVEVSGGLLTAGLAKEPLAYHTLVIAGALPAATVSDRTVTVGQTANFTAAVTGDGPFAYQWQLNGANIVNATNASHTIASVAMSDAGSYAVVVAGACGTATSPAATLTVNKATPSVTAWPIASAIMLGQTLAASTLSGGAGSVDGAFAFTTPATVPAEGTAAQSVTFTPADTGSYNGVTGFVSVTVVAPPAITAQPASAVVTVGQEARLSVSNSGAEPFGYQWLKDGILLPGQTNSSLSFSSFKFVDSGSYSVVITNALGMTISLPASLSVSNAPLRAWGYNNRGQLGNGTTNNANLPITVASNVVAAAGGISHSLFVKADGTLWAMGYNNYGQLGDGTTASTNRPVQVASNVAAVAGGSSHSLFVKADGTLWAMGYNINGQLGKGTAGGFTNLPVQVASNVVAAAGGGNHSLFVKADGTLWAMGYNNYGQLGDGTTGNASLPVQVASNVVSVACGGNYSLFVKADGTQWTIGRNNCGQLGNGTTGGSTNLPVQVANDGVASAGGNGHSLFVQADGTLRAMGYNFYGQLGNGTTADTNLPVQVANSVEATVGGQNHSLFVKADGTLWAMGQNNYGQLGNGTTGGSTNLPVQVTGDLLTASLAKGPMSFHSLAIAGVLPVVSVSNRTVKVGETASFMASVTGDGPFTYQWQLNGANLIDATNDSYSVASAALTDAGTYTANVSSFVGSASQSASLTVNPALATLRIISPHGTPTPTAGLYTNAIGTVLANCMANPEPMGGTQYVCTGWSMTGSEPASGTTTQCVMSVTNHAVLTWLWTTRYQLTTAAGPNGSVTVGSGWQPMGVTTQLTAVASPYYHFAAWSGDAGGTSNPLELLMDAPKSVTANFEANVTTTHPTPEAWLAQHGITQDFDQRSLEDADHDGMVNWQEYIAGTDPTNAASGLAVSQVKPLLGADEKVFGYSVTWPGVTGRVYNLEYSTNLLNWRDLEGATGLPGLSPANTFTDRLPSKVKFYRVKVRMPGDQ